MMFTLNDGIDVEENDYDDGEYTIHAILLATVPKIPAMLSIVGSCLMIKYLVGRRNTHGKRIKPFHRIMFGMSCADLVASMVYFVGTFPIPKGTIGYYGPVFWAVGSTTSCTICGAWAQLQICSPIYNGMLALYYFLTVILRWNERRIIAVEPYMHAVPLLYSIITALLGATVFDLYGSVEWLCWIAPSKSDDFKMFQWIFLFAPLWTCICWSTFVMLLLFRTMRKFEIANSRYEIKPSSSNNNNNVNSNSNSNSNSNRKDATTKTDISNKPINHDERSEKRSSQIAVHGMLYVIFFQLSWIFPTIQRFVQLSGRPGNIFALQMLDAVLLPLQGIFNPLIYARPRYLRLRKQHPNLPWLQLLYCTYAKKEVNVDRTRWMGQ